METEEEEADCRGDGMRGDQDEGQEPDDKIERLADQRLRHRVVRKLDFILLPFLCMLFLLNHLDKANIGNAETANFTRDTGLTPKDVNVALAFFFFFFVLLQPVGAALGRKYGMARFVPVCMSLWGLCTLMHILVKKRWQLVLLRIAIATLEAGFYPTTVAYLSMFYTRFEFAVRLGFFYGQAAVAGAIGGILSWAVFSRFPSDPGRSRPPELPPRGDFEETMIYTEWRSWEVLFMIEGCLTMAVALLGFIWLPHSADTAWFFNDAERQWAERRIREDRDFTSSGTSGTDRRSANDVEHTEAPSIALAEDVDESHHRLLNEYQPATPMTRQKSKASAVSVTHDTGLTRQDVMAALLSYKIWYLLVCNILSAIPPLAFGIFLPLVIKDLSPALDLSPAASNLLAAPPFAFGAVVLFVFTKWSDHSRQRLLPILWSLGLVLVGLSMTVLISMSHYIWRYMALCILLSGSYIASPLTVAWITNNTPDPGKRAIMLGLNGWGNFAGVLSSLLFTPDDEKRGYVGPFVVTLMCVVAAFFGFAVFRVLLLYENRWRDNVVGRWNYEEKEREEMFGDMRDVPKTWVSHLWRATRFDLLTDMLRMDANRRGDEKMTFRYGL